MAYMCTRANRECDGCGYCEPKQKETGVTITATLELRMTVYGEIERKLRKDEDVSKLADDLVQDTIECCGLAGENMSVRDIEYELNG